MAKNKTDNADQPEVLSAEVKNIAPTTTEFLTLGENGTCFYDPASKIFIAKGDLIPMPKLPSGLIRSCIQAGGLKVVKK